MERLTNKAWRNFDPWECCGQDKYCQRGCHDPGGCTKGCIVPRLYARLGACEATGLDPEEVDELAKDWSDLCTALGECGGIDALRELAEANKDGRLVVLPCKVGDTVYILRRTFDGADVVGETELWWTDIPQLGKTVFLTREEAEKALEAMKDG